ncbi:MAG TPA: VOC family protein, partial [Rubrobacteraceae bacterium]|nr:VOC family protein [Rubrobacteraceae bacterium]
DAAGAIEFYKQVFEATELFRQADADGKVRHAEVVIGDSPIMLTDEAPEYGMSGPRAMGGSPVSIFLYIEDVDDLFDRAIAAGAEEVEAVKDQPEGDRRGGVRDPFGYTWWLATQTEDISRAAMQSRFENLTDE